MTILYPHTRDLKMSKKSMTTIFRNDNATTAWNLLELFHVPAVSPKTALCATTGGAGDRKLKHGSAVKRIIRMSSTLKNSIHIRQRRFFASFFKRTPHCRIYFEYWEEPYQKRIFNSIDSVCLDTFQGCRTDGKVYPFLKNHRNHRENSDE